MDGSVVEFNSFNRAIIPQGARSNRNLFKQSDNLAGIYMVSDSVDHGSSAWGTMALTTSAIQSGYTISYRTQFSPKGWNDDITDMWDDFSDDGKFKDLQFDKKVNDPRSALSVRFQLAANETKEIEFFSPGIFQTERLE
jgi:hypothetical protein